MWWSLAKCKTLSLKAQSLCSETSTGCGSGNPTYILTQLITTVKKLEKSLQAYNSFLPLQRAARRSEYNYCCIFFSLWVTSPSSFKLKKVFTLYIKRRNVTWSCDIEGLLEKLWQMLTLSIVWYTAVWRTLIIWMLHCLISLSAARTGLTRMRCKKKKHAWISLSVWSPVPPCGSDCQYNVVGS